MSPDPSNAANLSKMMEPLKDLHRLDTDFFQPLLQMPGYELRAVFNVNECWRAA